MKRTFLLIIVCMCIISISGKQLAGQVKTGQSVLIDDSLNIRTDTNKRQTDPYIQQNSLILPVKVTNTQSLPVNLQQTENKPEVQQITCSTIYGGEAEPELQTVQDFMQENPDLLRNDNISDQPRLNILKAEGPSGKIKNTEIDNPVGEVQFPKRINPEEPQSTLYGNYVSDNRIEPDFAPSDIFIQKTPGIQQTTNVFKAPDGNVENLVLKSVEAAPNLTPYQPSGWDNKLVVSKVTGTYTSSSPIYDTDVLYVDWAVINNGSVNISTTFYTRLYVDGTLLYTWNTNSLSINYYTLIQDYNIGKLTAGSHTLRIVTDATGVITESSETDNEYTRTITVVNKNLTPYQPTEWDSKLVISSVSGTSSSTNPIFSTHTLYVDWAVTNNGTAAISETFHTKLYVDGVLSGTWYTSGLASGAWAQVLDHNIGSLSLGSHSIRIDTDVYGSVTETSEADNSYTRYITVYPYVNLTTYQSSGWDSRIVLSTVTGTNTTDSQILSTENIYLDWGIANVSSNATTTTFYVDLYIDGTWKAAWTRAGLGAYAVTTQLDYLVGKLSPGTHTFLIRIDRDGYVPEYNETDNEYSRTITVYNKNVLPYMVSGWDNKLVLSTKTGTSSSATAFYNNQDIYVDWAVVNNGSAAVTETFHSRLYVDGVDKGYWNTAGLASGAWAYAADHNIGKLAIGNHTFQIVTDCNGEVTESNEADNSYSRTIYVGPSYNLTPYKPGDYDDKLVLSTVSGTGTSASVFYDTDNIYVDWACLNNGLNDFTTTFYVRLYIDGVSKAAWTYGGLVHNTYTWYKDHNVGKLTEGTHTFRLVVDSDDDVAESDETDNEYTRTITVINKNLLPYQPIGWDNKIVLSTVTGTNTSASNICDTQPIYLDYAIWNNGSAPITETFYVRLYVDGIAKATWTRSGVGANTFYTIQDFSLGTLTAGVHTFKITADVLDNVDETSEADNEYSRTFTVSTCKNLTPHQPSGWDDKIVLSTAGGTHTSATTIYNNQNVYLDWAVINNGANNITETFSIKLYVDAVLKASWTNAGLAAGVYLYYSDFVIGTLTAGEHIFKIVADSESNVAETSEADNEYSRTFKVSLVAPVATAATSITQTGFNANWNAAMGATNYYLDVSTSNTFSSFVTGYNNKDVGNVLTFPVTGLTAGTTYYYRLRAYNTGGTSPNSNIISVITIPPAPVATAATGITQTGFSANWNASSGATGYYLDIATDNTFSNFVDGYKYKDVGNVLTSTVTGLSAGTTYYYRIRAYNTGGTSPSSNVITVTSVPAAPVATAASTIALVVFNANWNASTGATGYYLDVSTNNSFSSFVTGYNNKDVGNVITATVTGLSAGSTYYYRIRAYNLSGTSGSSNVITVSTIPPAPAAIAASSISQTGFNANWNTATGATAYYLDVATDNTFTSFVTGYNNKNVGNVLTSTVIGLSAGTTYYYRVKAGNTGGTGPNSNVIAVSTVPPAPVATAATGITQTSFSANWNASAGATGYYLDVATDNTFSDFIPGFNNMDVGNVLTLTVTGLTAGTSYTYRVRAYNTGGTSDNSNVIETVTTELCAQHFHPVWEGTAGFNHMNINVIEAKHEGLDLEAGDEIGVFDGSLCVGYGKVTETIDHDHALSIIVSQNDGSGNGFIPGHEILYIFWDCSSETEFNVNNVECVTNEFDPVLCSAFTSGATSFVSLSDLVVETQQISLNTGWNIMSMRVLPEIFNLKEILQSLIDEGKLKKVMDETGKTLEDWGIFGGWKNNIGDLQLTEGYKINVTDNAILEVQGAPVRLPFEIALITGWNIISWPSPNEQEGIEVFNALIADGKLKKVMDESGKTIEDWGIFGGWKNNIGNLKPGEGYNVNVNSDCILVINESGTKSEEIIPEQIASTHFIPAFKGNGTDHMNIHLVNLVESGIKPGDEIGVFDGNICVGSAKFDIRHSTFNIQHSAISIPVSATDGFERKNGFTPGNAIEVRLFRNGSEYPLTLQPLSENGTIFKKGSSLFAQVDLATGLDDLFNPEFTEINVYPNPFSEQITIAIVLASKQKVNVDVYDLKGALVRSLFENEAEGQLNVYWYGRNLAGAKMISGTYFIKVNDLTFKVILE